jgi:hypothetical protein
MRLFILDESMTSVELNKEWIHLVPEFSALIRSDKGSAGDYDGRKKLKARREFAYIYFMLDFTSPLRYMDEFDRREAAMQMAGLTEKDIDGPLMAAYGVYDKLLQNSSRSLKTLRSVQKGLDALDSYFENINFEDKDNKGSLVHQPNQYILNIERLGKAYDALDKFEKRVQEELTGEASIRGNASLGGKEGRREGGWDEGEGTPPELTEGAAGGGPVSTTSFADVAKILRNTKEYNTEES